MDLYGGYKYQMAGLSLDLGAITFRYPTRANTGAVGDVHHEEAYLGLSYAFLSAKFSYGLSNYFSKRPSRGLHDPSRHRVSMDFYAILMRSQARIRRSTTARTAILVQIGQPHEP